MEAGIKPGIALRGFPLVVPASFLLADQNHHAGWSPRLDLEDRLDLDGDAERQGVDTEGAACADAG